MSDVIQWILLRSCSSLDDAAECQATLERKGIQSQAFYDDGMPVYPEAESHSGPVEVRVERWNVSRARQVLADAGLPPDPHT
jgi:hypothetical protein